MPSPFHQKYSSQSHKAFGDSTVPAMPEAPKEDAQRRGSDGSMAEPSSPDGRRRSSAAQRYGNLEMLKRPTDQASVDRRSSLHDSYGKPGFLGTMWNKQVNDSFYRSSANIISFTRGPSSSSPPAAPKSSEARDISTLRG
ncbi:hypothetical protein EKO04_009193 [Ascochyta lentis]|uniref:Uncharacterized protein n=1 Tax=Ascochyta lentis TaxID=205686 RepID=A0A8H7MH18_9PLEO|nr:hypothetical protein EKO04_009193 [Ascochyta lentis]